MPKKQTTTYTVTEEGTLQGRTAGQDLSPGGPAAP